MSWLRNVVHNCLVHPVLPFVPGELGDLLHRMNAGWAFSGSDRLESGARRREDALVTAMQEGVDITIHDLMHLVDADTPGAELFRVVCQDWAADIQERAGLTGPRIGTVYVENRDGLLEIRLVTRLPYPRPSLKVVAA